MYMYMYIYIYVNFMLCIQIWHFLGRVWPAAQWNSLSERSFHPHTQIGNGITVRTLSWLLCAIVVMPWCMPRNSPRHRNHGLKKMQNDDYLNQMVPSFYHISWYFMIFHDISWYFHDISWYFMIFPWYFHDISMIFHDISWYFHDSLVKYA